MAELRQCIESLGLDRRTCDFCLKCDFSYQERFDNAGPKTRQSFVEALAACTFDDFTNPLPVLGLITLLSESEFEDFIARLARRAPFDASLAWSIIRLSSHGVGAWFFERGKAKFQRCFHHHPTVAPLLIQAARRPGHESEDIIALFDCYEPVADQYPELRAALPLWQKELKRRADERIAQEQREKLERLRQEAEQTEWKGKINAITYEGPQAILQAMADTLPSETWRFPDCWGRIPDVKLRDQNATLLARALPALCGHAEVRCWRSLAHKVRSALQTQKRAADIKRLATFPHSERLQAACNSRWSLTYYPLDWAEEFLPHAAGISDHLRKSLLAKLMRLHRRGPWRSLRQKLIRKR